MRPSLITIANERVPIAMVLRSLGVDLSDLGGQRSLKTYCPFGGLFHSDSGISPAMRVYPDSNSAYCFSCSSYFTPVGLAAQAMDVHPAMAAERLLDQIGYRPLDLAGRWKTATDFEPELDKSLLAEALKTYCRRVSSDWARRQFDPGTAGALTRCLALLDLVRTPDDATLWLSSCKVAMKRILISVS